MTRVYLSVGSNTDRQAMIRAALLRLGETFPDLQCSPIYQSPPVEQGGEDYYNLVVGFDTEKPVTDLRACLQAIEQSLGRDRRTPHRVTMDLDLLLYGDRVQSAGPPLPHPDILRYAHVLIPLTDLAPELIHPTEKVSLCQLRGNLFPHSNLHPAKIALD